jgi:hypothetical protein
MKPSEKRTHFPEIVEALEVFFGYLRLAWRRHGRKHTQTQTKKLAWKIA